MEVHNISRIGHDRSAATMTQQAPYLSPTPDGKLLWGPLTQATLVKRYKRFLADVTLPDGTLLTAHTPNTGSMLGCSQPGRPVWLSHHDSPKRKYPYTLELIDMPHGLVGVNTGVPNRLVKAAALAGKIPEFSKTVHAQSEVKTGSSRLDLKLVDNNDSITMIEIKNCTLVENRTALFPDAVSARGSKHLEELAALADSGVRAVLFVLVQRMDAEKFSPADHIDPHWGTTLRNAMAKGVEVVVYQAQLDTEGISIGIPLPVMT